jgi:hypothetical protein
MILSDRLCTCNHLVSIALFVERVFSRGHFLTKISGIMKGFYHAKFHVKKPPMLHINLHSSRHTSKMDNQLGAGGARNEKIQPCILLLRAYRRKSLEPRTQLETEKKP